VAFEFLRGGSGRGDGNEELEKIIVSIHEFTFITPLEIKGDNMEPVICIFHG
jgi:hypothetical protein